MNKKLNMFIGHTHMFMWMIRHVYHFGERKGIVMKTNVDVDTTTTTGRCLRCGKTFRFTSE